MYQANLVSELVLSISYDTTILYTQNSTDFTQIEKKVLHLLVLKIIGEIAWDVALTRTNL